MHMLTANRRTIFLNIAHNCPVTELFPFWLNNSTLVHNIAVRMLRQAPGLRLHSYGGQAPRTGKKIDTLIKLLPLSPEPRACRRVEGCELINEAHHGKKNVYIY